MRRSATRRNTDDDRPSWHETAKAAGRGAEPRSRRVPKVDPALEAWYQGGGLFQRDLEVFAQQYDRRVTRAGDKHLTYGIFDVWLYPRTVEIRFGPSDVVAHVARDAEAVADRIEQEYRHLALAWDNGGSGDHSNVFNRVYDAYLDTCAAVGVLPGNGVAAADVARRLGVTAREMGYLLGRLRMRMQGLSLADATGPTRRRIWVPYNAHMGSYVGDMRMRLIPQTRDNRSRAHRTTRRR